MTQTNNETVDVGVVKNVSGNFCYVTITKNERCNGCKACAFGKNDTITIKALNEAKSKKGDRVAVTVRREQNTKLSYLVLFCLPLALMIIGALVGFIIQKSDLGALVGIAVGVLLGLVVCFLVNCFVEKKAKQSGKFPKVTKIL